MRASTLSHNALISFFRLSTSSFSSLISLTSDAAAQRAAERSRATYDNRGKEEKGAATVRTGGSARDLEARPRGAAAEGEGSVAAVRGALGGAPCDRAKRNDITSPAAAPW